MDKEAIALSYFHQSISWYITYIRAGLKWFISPALPIKPYGGKNVIKNNLKYKTKSKEDKQQEMNTIIKTLEDGVIEVFDSEKYKRLLEFYSKFHNYSINNIILILMQRPDARKCASYTIWKSLKMQVRKGEKGIKILCPVPYSYRKKGYADEDENTLISGVRFKIGHVFDISQIEGDMPTLADELTDNPENLKDIIDNLINSSPITITYDYNLKKNDGNGYYDLLNKSIALRAGMSTLQTFKTIIHEIAHSILHNDDKCSNEEAEVQAESIAFVVCSALGLDTIGYSFEYVATWSSGKELRELRGSLSVIEKTSKEILKLLKI